MIQRRWLADALVALALASAGCAPDFIYPSVHFTSSPSGDSVVFRAEGGGTWLRRRSLANGALLASERFRATTWRDFTLGCRPSVPGRLWCLENGADPLKDNGLLVRDEASLKVIAEQNEILGRTPALAGEPPLRAWHIDPKTRGFQLESRDGYIWIIDPTTLVPSRFDGPMESSPKPGDSSPSSRCPSYRVGSHCYYFKGATKQKTLVRDGIELHPEHTYLMPELVLEVEDFPRVLIVENQIDSSAHPATLWCLSLDGAVAWKVTDFGKVNAAKLAGDKVVLVGPNRLVAVRPEDGTLVWTSPP
jgi:hypothetical protein